MDGFLDIKEWTYKIYDNFQNPFQLLREIIVENEITGDEILHKFRLKIYDDPLDLVQFKNCLKKLDPELNNIQIKNMFNELKHEGHGKVEIPLLIANLTGEQMDTVDFRNKMFKLIWNHIEKTS
jgi:Ca2+-binding EF-hand superfamily protein